MSFRTSGKHLLFRCTRLCKVQLLFYGVSNNLAYIDGVHKELAGDGAVVSVTEDNTLGLGSGGGSQAL